MHTPPATFDFASSFTERCTDVLRQDALYNLNHLGLIAVSGPEAAAFLFKQFTSDLKLISPQRSQLSGYCNPKGRLLAIFRIFQREDIFYISLPLALLEPTLKRLKMFVLMAKVSLNDATNSLASAGLAGPAGDRLLTNLLGSIPANLDDVLHINGITVLRLPGPFPRFQLIGEANTLPAISEKLLQDASPAAISQWELQDIISGSPVILPGTVEEFIPQMVNLHLLGGVSFKKGCYPGQEIVARTQYLGKLKRRLYLAFCPTAAAISPGAGIYPSAAGVEQKAGVVVNAQPCSAQGSLLLAVIDNATATAGELYLHTPQPLRLELGALPYEVN